MGKVEDARRQERKFMEDAKRPQSWSVQRYMDFLNAATKAGVGVGDVFEAAMDRFPNKLDGREFRDAADEWNCRRNHVLVRFAEFTSEKPSASRLASDKKLPTDAADWGGKAVRRPPPVRQASKKSPVVPALVAALIGAGVAAVAAPTIPVVLGATAAMGLAGYVVGKRKG